MVQISSLARLLHVNMKRQSEISDKMILYRCRSKIQYTRLFLLHDSVSAWGSI